LLLQSSATDVSAQTTMKGVAKCDKHFELQSSVSQQNLERTLRSQEIPESTPASVPTAFTTSSGVCFCALCALAALGCVLLRVKELAFLSRSVYSWRGCASMATM